MKLPRFALLLGVAALTVVGWGMPRGAVSQVAAPAVVGDRFTFDVVESFDARYEGDTPGHMGRNGGLGEVRPHVALGDHVFRDDVQVGTVTGLKWTRAQGALEIEFDPSAKSRIAVGDVVWVKLGGAAAK
jgi:hypothetical protein